MSVSMSLVSPRVLKREERSSRPLDPHEARVAVSMTGVCGTDLAIWSGNYPVPLPLVLGHEWVGRVTEIGSDAPRDLVRSRVTGEINNSCAMVGQAPMCESCRRGMPNHCLNRTVTGIVVHDGAFQQELIVPWKVLHRIPDTMPDEEAIFVEPLAAALQTFELSPLGKGDLVVVLGAGRLGVLAALVAKALGATVLTVMRDEERQRRLRALGLETFLFSAESRVPAKDPLEGAASPLRDAVLEQTNGLGADVVVETTGSPEGLPLALDLVRPRGTIALKSTPGQPVRSFDLTRFVVNEVRIQGSRCGPFDKAIVFQQRHRLPLVSIVVDTFDLEALDRAFEAALTAPGKIAVRIAPAS